MLLINSKKRAEELKAYPHVLPASSLGVSAGRAIIKYILSRGTNKNPTASIAFKGTVYGDRAPVMAAFSSRGPNVVGPDIIKPDVTAPGLNILAAWPALTSPTRLKSDKRRVLFNIDSGTSMSCPHVSGIAALLKSRHKDWSPAAIKSALMTTAYVTDNKGSPILDIAFIPLLHLLHLAPVMLIRRELLIQVNFNKRAENIRVTYKRTVTNVGAPKSTYKVLVEEPKGVSMTVNPKILTFQKLGEKLSYTVSFIGTKPRAASSFGSLVWLSGKYSVRSPIAASWI
ncbi:hypothetical protein PTKIN_Ptkin12aG0191900 [Pterospermum kingtungense]